MKNLVPVLLPDLHRGGNLSKTIVVTCVKHTRVKVVKNNATQKVSVRICFTGTAGWL